jgi:alpha-glucuronidase
VTGAIDRMKKIYCLVIFVLVVFNIYAENGYELWLRYKLVSNPTSLNQYKTAITGFTISGNSPLITSAKEELSIGLEGLLGKKITPSNAGSLIIGTPKSSPAIAALKLNNQLANKGADGFIIMSAGNSQRNIVIAANTDAGVLYGVFHFLRLLQTNQSLQNLHVSSTPKIKHRLLNHWDNLNRSVERGYAGFSLWNWHMLPDYIDQRYIDYARANASIGINGSVITNVNANADILTKEYLVKIAALANVFRRYGIKLYLTARFSAPIEIGKLKTADPLDEGVRQWWKDKVTEIYTYIPDFGGFLVKANSEGQPGPQDYKRNHADGANMLADAVAPHSGVIMWRAFVYSHESPEDRLKQAYTEFKPLDGKFRKM